MNIGDIYISSQLRPNQQAGIRVERIELNQENNQTSRVHFLRLHPMYNGEVFSLTFAVLEASSWVALSGN